jgi:recombination protein RecT
VSNLSGQIEKAGERPTVESLLQREREGLASALAERIGVDRFLRGAVTLYKTAPDLQQCDWTTVLGALFVAAQLGLEVGGPRGLAYVVPYKGKAQLIIGYRGYVDLFYKAGARKVEALVVREGDHFRQYSNGQIGRTYDWEPKDNDSKRSMVGVIGQVRLASGDFIFEYMTREQVDARRPAYATSGPWKDWYEEMALKTVMRQLAKTARQATDDLGIAIENDNAIITHHAGDIPATVTHVPVVGSGPGGELTEEEFEKHSAAEFAREQEAQK